MAYDVTNITDKIGKVGGVLTSTLYAGGDTSKFARYIHNVKGKTTITALESEAVLQKGNCVPPSGDVSGKEYDLEVVQLTNFKSFCTDDLMNKFPYQELAPGSYSNQAPKDWEDKMIESEMASINKQLEMNFWQGDVAGATYTAFDGYIKKIDASSEAIDGNTSAATSITVANVMDLIEDLIDATPVDVREADDFVIVVGKDTFRKYSRALKNANLYHHSVEDVKNGEYYVDGSSARLISVRGLEGTDRMFATRGSHFIVGDDLADEEQKVDFIYDEVTQLNHIRTKFKAGVTIVNPDEIVEFTLSV